MSDEREHILVVDDEPDTLELLVALLESANYSVESADNGKACLEMVKARRPDLIVLDIMMPGMDGLEVCDHLRFDPATREIPIIFLTAKGDDYTRTIASILDAYAFIEKPFLPDRLLGEVRNCLNIFGRNTCDDDRQHEGP